MTNKDGYSIDFNVKLWDYVLLIDNEVIRLNKSTIHQAEWYAKMIVEGRKRKNEQQKLLG
jgi:hypothetical protein